MESKRKKRQVHREPQVPKDLPLKQKSPEALIKFNGELVESLFASEAWREIAFPLLQESIASVSGRFTNGRFHQGNLTRTRANREELAGYQLALEEFYNRLSDFIEAKNNLIKKKKQEEVDKQAPFYNPFMEEQDYEKD
jgi:hypothetical protein